MYHKEKVNSLAGSRTLFICTCKQPLDHCTTVPLSFGGRKFAILKAFFFAIDVV